MSHWENRRAVGISQQGYAELLCALWEHGARLETVIELTRRWFDTLRFELRKHGWTLAARRKVAYVAASFPVEENEPWNEQWCSVDVSFGNGTVCRSADLAPSYWLAGDDTIGLYPLRALNLPLEMYATLRPVDLFCVAECVTDRLVYRHEAGTVALRRDRLGFRTEYWLETEYRWTQRYWARMLDVQAQDEYTKAVEVQ